MIKIPEIVEVLVRERPFLEKALADNIINLTSLARNFKPEIERRIKKEVQVGAIVMALKRLPIQPGISLKNNIAKIADNLGDLIVRSNLADFTFRNSMGLMEKQKELLKLIGNNSDVFYTFSRGVFESTFIISNDFSEQMKEIFINEDLISLTEELSSITIKLKQENTVIPGFYYHILKSLAWENINITEIVSTSNEFTIIVKDTFVDKTFSVMKKLKSFDINNPYQFS